MSLFFSAAFTALLLGSQAVPNYKDAQYENLGSFWAINYAPNQCNLDYRRGANTDFHFFSVMTVPKDPSQALVLIRALPFRLTSPDPGPFEIRLTGNKEVIARDTWHSALKSGDDFVMAKIPVDVLARWLSSSDPRYHVLSGNTYLWSDNVIGAQRAGEWWKSKCPH